MLNKHSLEYSSSLSKRKTLWQKCVIKCLFPWLYSRGISDGYCCCLFQLKETYLWSINKQHKPEMKTFCIFYITNSEYLVVKLNESFLQIRVFDMMCLYMFVKCLLYRNVWMFCLCILFMFNLSWSCYSVWLKQQY